MPNANLYAQLRARHASRPASPCMLFADGSAWSYAELDARSAQYANALVHLGLKPGDRVAVQVDKSGEAVALYLATLRAGGVFLPLNTGYQKSELAYFFGNAEPSVIVVAPDKLAASKEIASYAQVLDMNEHGLGALASLAKAQAKNFMTVERSADDLAAMLYTSGTTGRAKGAMLTHRNLASNAEVLVQQWGFTANDCLLHMLPIYHVHGLFVALHCVLMSGARMLFEPKFEINRALALLPQASVMMGVPTFYTRLLSEARFKREAVSGVRLFVSGSAPLLAETHIDFQARTGQAILERYGMTETGMLTSNPLNGERVAGTVGKPLPGVEVRVAGAQGEIGGIEVKGPNVFPGYWRMPEKTKEEFTADGYFKTGDMGQWLPNGYLQIVGRSKDLIITGGLNVYPKEIEERIDALPGVVESAVIGIPHPDFGEAVMAVVVVKSEADLTEHGIIQTLKADLANFKVPKRVAIVSDLPRNAMGKVQKALLRERYGSD